MMIKKLFVVALIGGLLSAAPTFAQGKDEKKTATKSATCKVKVAVAGKKPLTNKFAVAARSYNCGIQVYFLEKPAEKKPMNYLKRNGVLSPEPSKCINCGFLLDELRGVKGSLSFSMPGYNSSIQLQKKDFKKTWMVEVDEKSKPARVKGWVKIKEKDGTIIQISFDVPLIEVND